jgi:hypothetical protein
MIERFRGIISRYVPESAVEYCITIWQRNPFSFKVTRQRRSKVGDYRYNKKTGNHEITVNGNLNSYAFLITYLHEVAHLIQFHKHGHNRSPHGWIWKKIFKELMTPVLTPTVFPPDILGQLQIHMENPKASSQGDPELSKRLRNYDQYDRIELLLEDFTEGDSFILNGRAYTKLKKRRTRSLCVDERTGRKYLISEMAQVTMPGSK